MLQASPKKNTRLHNRTALKAQSVSQPSAKQSKAGNSISLHLEADPVRNIAGTKRKRFSPI